MRGERKENFNAFIPGRNAAQSGRFPPSANPPGIFEGKKNKTNKREKAARGRMVLTVKKINMQNKARAFTFFFPLVLVSGVRVKAACGDSGSNARPGCGQRG